MATLWQKARLLRGLIDGEVAYGGPFYVDVDVTRRCNLSCIGCPYHSSRTSSVVSSDPTVRDVPFEQIEQLCRELRRMGTGEVILVGEGEPLLHPRIHDIVSSFKDAGFKVQLFTNGTLIDQPCAEAILESGLDVLRVSLWANSAEEYRLCHPGVSLDFLDRTLSGVKTLTGLKAKSDLARPKVVLTEPLMRHNYASVPMRIRLAHDLGCNAVAFDTYRDRRGEFASAALSAEQIQELCRALRRQRSTLESLALEHNLDTLLLKYRLGKTAWRHLPCYAGWFFARIRVDGTVVPCGSCSLPMGNVTNERFVDLWNGPRYRAFRRRASSAAGLRTLGADCECSWCCHVGDNFLIHRYAKWISAFRRHGG